MYDQEAGDPCYLGKLLSMHAAFLAGKDFCFLFDQETGGLTQSMSFPPLHLIDMQPFNVHVADVIHALESGGHPHEQLCILLNNSAQHRPGSGLQ
eukprot:1160868-Pelagomonas_calceolata.AAC.9